MLYIAQIPCQGVCCFYGVEITESDGVVCGNHTLGIEVEGYYSDFFAIVFLYGIWFEDRVERGAAKVVVG